MRKTTALLSATTLGVVAVAAGGAASASADIITEPRCADFDQHDDGAPDINNDWYMDCVPQYGVGKAEFVLEAPDAGFPEDLDVALLTRTNSPDASGVAAYYADYPFGGDTLDSWITPEGFDPDSSTETSLRVSATLVAPVTSVGRLDETPDAVAAECELDGEFAEADEVITFVSNYAPVTTTLSYVGADGITYSAPVTATPDPSYFVFINTIDPQSEAITTTICITDTHQTAIGDADEGFSLVYIGLLTVPPYNWFEDIGGDDGTLPQLGTFAFAAPAAEEPAAELADSGSEHVVPLGITAGVLGGLGALLLAFSRRRRPQE